VKTTKHAAVNILFAIFICFNSYAANVRTVLWFPIVNGLVPIKCDFHIHTVFSDGNVWPTTRPLEAWQDGLDAIAITDHIEYLPHTNDIHVRFNRSYDLAKPIADQLNVVLIKGAEITRGEPPGHWNAIFLRDINRLSTEKYEDAISNAVVQGAFIFWNHPGWKQPNRKSVWYAEQQKIYEAGNLHGIEIVNGSDYDPIAHRWCVEKGLTMLGNSDIHEPISMVYKGGVQEHRPVTIVYAKTNDIESIKTALFLKQTIVWHKDLLLGSTNLLDSVFRGSIKVLNQPLSFKGQSRVVLQIQNFAPVPFKIEPADGNKEFSWPTKFTIPAGAVVAVDVKSLRTNRVGRETVSIPVNVENLNPLPDQPLKTTLEFECEFSSLK
jgi:hypothetical protein